MDKLLALGYGPIYGARPMKRVIQGKIETLAARELIKGSVLPGDTLLIDAGDGTEDFTASAVSSRLE